MNSQPHPTPAIQAQNLGLVYAENEGKAALAGIDLQVCTGEVVGVLGKSGAGEDEPPPCAGWADRPDVRVG